eukprot:7381227-Prymnesium_polylepis.1
MHIVAYQICILGHSFRKGDLSGDGAEDNRSTRTALRHYGHAVLRRQVRLERHDDRRAGLKHLREERLLFLPWEAELEWTR